MSDLGPLVGGTWEPLIGGTWVALVGGTWGPLVGGTYSRYHSLVGLGTICSR